MKLAEALILRADHQKRLEQLKQRLIRNAKIQEGDAPAENPVELIEEMERVANDLLRLIQRINATNSLTRFDDQLTISDAIAVRDILRARQAIYRELAQAATIKQDRLTKSEIKFRSAVNVAEMQKQADSLAREHRELDAKLQEANWLTEMRE